MKRRGNAKRIMVALVVLAGCSGGNEAATTTEAPTTTEAAPDTRSSGSSPDWTQKHQHRLTGVSHQAVSIRCDLRIGRGEIIERSAVDSPSRSVATGWLADASRSADKPVMSAP